MQKLLVGTNLGIKRLGNFSGTLSVVKGDSNSNDYFGNTTSTNGNNNPIIINSESLKIEQILNMENKELFYYCKTVL